MFSFRFKFIRSSTPVQHEESEDERCARANFQWFLSSLSVPVFRDTHPFKVSPTQSPNFNNNSSSSDDYNSFGLGLSLVAMLTRLKVENDRRNLFAKIYEGPISNRGKVRLN